MQPAASASASSTIVIGATLLPANGSRAEAVLAAPPQSRYQQSARLAAASPSPSPPMSTCRRLSYDSAMMGSGSPSRTRMSPSSSASSRSRSHPLSQQQRPFWRTCVLLTDVTTTTVSRRSTAAFGRAGVAVTGTCVQQDSSSPVDGAHSSSTPLGSATAPSSPNFVPSAAVTDVPVHVTAKPECVAIVAGAHEQRPPEAAAAVAVTVATSLDACGGKGVNEGGDARPLPSAAAFRSAAALRPLSTCRQSPKTTAQPSDNMPIAQPQPQRAAPPPQPRRSRSANSSVRGAGTHTNSVYFQPVPTLRNVGTGGPSPFSAEQLAMPRRPQSRPAVVTADDGVSWAGCMPRASTTATVAATTMTSAHQRAPHVQLVRPADLCRTAAGSNGPASTAMAASLLPGAAAAQDRLQLPHRSRLTRTPSATAAQQRRRTPSAGSFGGGGSARNSESAASSTPRKRRASTSPPGGASQAPVEGSTARLAPRRPRSNALSGPLSAYTTRRASGGRSPLGRSEQWIPDNGTTSDAAALRKSLPRSNSAPAHRQCRASSTGRTSSAVPGSVTSRALRVSNGLGAPAVAPPSLVRSASVTSVHQRRPLATTATPVGSARRSSVPRRSRSRDGTSATVRSSAAGKSALTSLQTATAPMTARVLNMSTATTAHRVIAGSTRPTISTAGAGGPRVRPVVSMATAAAAAPAATPTVPGSRRLADRKQRGSGSDNTVCTSQSSMISMEESNAFLEQFQRMNERELALFGTLLATVAAEQQKRSGRGITSNAASSVDKTEATRLVGNTAGDRDAVIPPPTGSITSAEDVTVWACKRTVASPSHHQRGQQQTSDVPTQPTPGESVVVAPTVSHADEELIVLVHPRSRSTGPHVPPAASMSGSETPQQPNQLAQRTDRDEEKRNGHVPATLYAFARSSPYRQYYQPKQQCMGAGTAAGGRSSGDGAVLPRASRSPSPVPHPPASAAGRKENDQPAPSLISVSRSPVPECPLRTPTGARAHPGARAPQQQQPGAVASARDCMSVSGGLRPREPTFVNISENCTAAGAARKLSVVAMAAVAASTVMRGTAPDRPFASATRCIRRRGRRRCGANDGTDASLSPPEEQWRRSVKSYTDITRSYTPNRLEGSHDGNSGNNCGANVKQGGMRLDEDPDVVDASVSSAVLEAAAPLTALKRAKEMASEMAAAARAKTVAAEKLSATMMSTSPFLPSATAADSPTSSRASGGYAAAAAAEISSVRVTAAQLQLLIEGSRSQANYARYRPLLQ